MRLTCPKSPALSHLTAPRRAANATKRSRQLWAVLALLMLASLLMAGSRAEAANTKPVAKASKKASPPAARRSKSKAAPTPEPAPEPLTEQQLEVATRVQTGSVDCEFKQKVELLAVADQPGRFHLQHLGRRYTMVPLPTYSGAVRLEDAKAGIVWLQIPAKSMLMNTRIGQRMVDNCQSAQQLADQAFDMVVAQAASAAGQAAAPGLLSDSAPAAGLPAAAAPALLPAAPDSQPMFEPLLDW